MLKSLFQRILSKNSANGRGSTAVIMQPQKIYLFEPNRAELENILNSPMPAGKAPGYVYFVQEHMNGSFKIGKTKYIEKRMNVFGVKLPFEHKLVYLIKTGNHHQTEASFHRHFSAKRLEGEWFALNKEDINWIKKGNYTFKINQSIKDNVGFNNYEIDDDSMPLTIKQIEYAKSLIKRLEKDYEFISDYSSLTQKDLNRLSGYFRYKNIGAINNLVKKGVLKLK